MCITEVKNVESDIDNLHGVYRRNSFLFLTENVAIQPRVEGLGSLGKVREVNYPCKQGKRL